MSKIQGPITHKETKTLSQKERQSLIPQLKKQLRKDGLENLLEPICSELWLEWGLHLFISYEGLQVFLADVTTLPSSEKYFKRVYPEHIVENELRTFLFDKMVAYMAESEESTYRHFKKRKYRVRRFKALVVALQTSNQMAPFLFQWLLEFSYTLGMEYKNRMEECVEKSTTYRTDDYWMEHLNGWWETTFRCGKHVDFVYSTYEHHNKFIAMNFEQAIQIQDFENTYKVVFAGREKLSQIQKDDVKKEVWLCYLSTLFDAAMQQARSKWDDASRQEALDRLLTEKRLWCNLIYVYWMRR